MNTILERINQVCKNVRDANPGQVSFKRLINQTRRSFKNYDFDLCIKTKKERSLDNDKFYIMAYYDSYEDHNGDTPIEVVVHHNLDGTELFGPHQVVSFLIEIYDAVAHEHRHQQQSVRRNYVEYETHSRSPYNEYLSSNDEIDAYALSIAIEMLRHMSKYRAMRYMSRITVMSKMRKGPYFAIPMLSAYIGQFEFGHVIKRLSKKVYKFLDSLDRQHIFM
jgi:hypothetical protein